MLTLHSGHLLSQSLFVRGHFVSMPLILLLQLLDMLLSLCGGLFLEVFDFGLQLLNLRDETGLQLLLHLGVLFDLLGELEELLLELLSGRLAVPHELLVLSYVLLQVVEDLQFLIEGNQRVQLVLKFYLLFFERQLQLVFVALVEHLSCERASCDRFGDRGRGRCLALLPGHLGLHVGLGALPLEFFAPGRTLALR